MDAALLVVLLIVLVLGALWWRERRGRLVAEEAIMASPALRSEPAAPCQTFLAIAAALDDGLLVTAADRRISFCNAAAGPLLGIPEGELPGQTLMAALRDFDADQAVESALRSDETRSATLRVHRSGRTVRLTCRPLEGPDAGALIVLHDLTRLGQLERARRDMVANVSHELRTPLASIRLLVETLATEPPPDLARRMLGQIDDELSAMTQLVDELRELAQIESGRLVLRVQPTVLPDLIEQVGERLRAQIERRGLRLDCQFAPGLPLVLVDEVRIGQVLLNLLHNALKWTPAGGTITVTAIVVPPASDERTVRELQQLDGMHWVRLSVRDTGIGIPSGETERIFERFYKVDRARTRDGGGTGLGLAIAKHLVEHHGGRIWAESREEQGSTFSLLLPVA